MRTIAVGVIAGSVLVGCGSVAARTAPALDANHSRSLPPQEIAERTFAGMAPLACGGIGPLPLLSASPGAEKADTPAARGLREVFAHDPTGGESPQTPHGWVLLARRNGEVTFGQRVGRIGLGATVTLRRADGIYRWAGSGGCGPIGYADGRGAVPIYGVTERGRRLTVAYEGGSCDRRRPTVSVHVTATSVDVLLVGPKPLTPAEDSGGATVCLGVGRQWSVTTTLHTPIGDRPVHDIAYLPARVIVPAR